MTLNLIRKSGAYQYLNGKFDYSKTPVAPIGTVVVTYNDCAKRGSWDPHGDKGWYCGFSYRAFRILVSSTNRMRVSDTVSWHPASLADLPPRSVSDDLLDAIDALTSALVQYDTTPPTTRHSPSLPRLHGKPASAILAELRTLLYPPVDFEPTAPPVVSPLTVPAPPQMPIVVEVLQIPAATVPIQRVAAAAPLAVVPTAVPAAIAPVQRVATSLLNSSVPATVLTRSGRHSRQRRHTDIGLRCNECCVGDTGTVHAVL